jgi:hypothetical protein
MKAGRERAEHEAVQVSAFERDEPVGAPELG